MIQNNIFGILFFGKYFKHTTFHIRPHVLVDIIRVFLISDFLAESLKVNKI